MTTYAEFRLRIERGATPGSYRVAASGLGGEAPGTFAAPFTATELENFVLKVGRTRRGVRRIESPEMGLARAFGGRLFSALISGKVDELYRTCLGEARTAGQGLRVTLSLSEVPELGGIPWEYLFDEPDFLSISTWTPVVRYLDVPKPRRPLQVELPLRILGIVSAPSDAGQLDAGLERTRLEEALRPVIDAKAVSVDWLEEASLLALARTLRSDEYHIIHYIGHGGFDDASGEGALLFEDEAGRGRPVSGDQIATILHDKVSLRLVLLNSCEGARNSVDDPFSGVATSLVQREIPAVIGMQFEITDRAAVLFAGEFYSMLAEGRPVNSAVAEARLAIYADQNDVEWGTPVLFMRVADGQLFDVANAAAIPRRDPQDLPPKVASSPDPVPAGAAAAAAATVPADTSQPDGQLQVTDAQPGALPGTSPPEGVLPVAAVAAGAAASMTEEGVPIPALPPAGGSAEAALPGPKEAEDALPGPALAGTTAAAGLDRLGAAGADGDEDRQPIQTTRAPEPAPAIGPLTMRAPEPAPAARPLPGQASPLPARFRWRRIVLGLAAVVVLLIIGRAVLPTDTGASIAVSAASTLPGRAVLVTGTGFTRGEDVDLSLDANPAGTVVAAADGSIRAALEIGDRTRVEVAAVGRTSGREARSDYSPTTAASSGSSPRSVAPGSTAPGSAAPGSAAPAPAAPVSPGILFYSNLEPGSNQTDNELYLLDPASGKTTQLTHNGVDDTFPTWSPDYRQIAFTRKVNGTRDIYIREADGSERPLTSGRADDYFPAWSKDGWIAFVRTVPPSKDSAIWVIRSDGSGAHEVVHGYRLRSPAWSPDGTMLALTANLDPKGTSGYDVAIVRPDGSGYERLTTSPASERNPAWSPDQRTIAFVRGDGIDDASNDVYLLDVATKRVTRRLTHNAVQDGNPVWSPDGRQIAFYRASTGDGYHLWVVNADGTGARDLMPTRGGRNLDPNWR